MTITKDTAAEISAYLTDRAEHLQHLLYSLEQADSRLFVDANGNLPTYRDWERQVRDINKWLGELSDETNTRAD